MANSEELYFLITGNNKGSLSDCIKEIKKDYEIKLNIKIINNPYYTKEDFYKKYYDNIDKGIYFNAFILNYLTKEEIKCFFKEFNKDYYNNSIMYNSYPFFLIDENIYNKKELINDIKKINEQMPIQYRIQSKDILAYSNDNSFKNKIIQIYKYYTENENLLNKSIEEKKNSLNILLLGIQGVGKTFLMNKLLFENRGLSKEHNYTTKFNNYHHKLYPINFYDAPGFVPNEDFQMENNKSNISQFYSYFEKIKNKIHIILYLSNSDSSRPLQDKEIELIEKLLTFNIPIYFIGNQSNPKDEKTFKRSILYKLRRIKSNQTWEYFESHIFCLNNTNKSIFLLLEKISKELEKSKEAHINIISEYKSNKITFDSNNSNCSSEEENINNCNCAQKKQHQYIILREMQNSIFFNDLSNSINKIQEKLLQMIEAKKENSKAFLPFKSLEKDFLELSNQIEKEYSIEINAKIQQKKENIIEQFLEKDYLRNSYLIDFLNSLSSVFLPLSFFNVISPYFLILSFVGLISFIFKLILKKISNVKKIEDFSNLINQELIKHIILDDIFLIEQKSENFNEIIDKFNIYIKHFQTENENDIDLIE